MPADPLSPTVCPAYDYRAVLGGYSFADEHINDVICRSLEANPTAHVFACVFGELERENYKLARQCALATPNLSLLGFDKAIVGRTLGEWSGEGGDDLALPSSILVKDGDKVTLRLGDFAALGILLRGLSGDGMSDDPA